MSVFVRSFPNDSNAAFGLGFAPSDNVIGRLEEKFEGKLKGKHILVVEDHPRIGALLVNFLKQYAHASYTTSGKEAIKEIKHKRPDIVLLDLNLPDMNGLDVARKLRENQRTKSIPILSMSGYRIEKKRWLEAGCNDFILKPFDTLQLLAQLIALVRP